MLGRQRVFDLYLDADKVINVPIAKHHGLTRVTLGLKNLYGIIGGNRSRLHQDINNSIADLGNFLRPTLTVLDGMRVLLHNGPQGGSLDDVEERNTIAASIDPVALDAWGGSEFFGLDGGGHALAAAGTKLWSWHGRLGFTAAEGSSRMSAGNPEAQQSFRRYRALRLARRASQGFFLLLFVALLLKTNMDVLSLRRNCRVYPHR
jgi:hypothetical protein